MAATTTTTTNGNLEHAYQVGGVLAVSLSFGVLAHRLGVLARCGMGRGLCFDTASHAAGDAGLVVFIHTFIIGAGLYVGTGETATFTSRPKSPGAPVTPLRTTTNVFPCVPAAASLAPAVTNVFPMQAPPPANVSYVVPLSPTAIPANSGTIRLP